MQKIGAVGRCRPLLILMQCSCRLKINILGEHDFLQPQKFNYESIFQIHSSLYVLQEKWMNLKQV